MANPKRRHSRSRRDKRRANWKLDTVNYGNCNKCGAVVLPHKACPTCGFYNGEIAVLVKNKAEKAAPTTQVQTNTETTEQ